MTPLSFEEERIVYGELPPFGVVSIWFGGVLVLITAVTQIIQQTVQPIWTHPLVSVLELILMGMIAGSILFLAANHQYGIKIVAIPLLVNMGTLLIIQTVSFDRMWEDARFAAMSYGLSEVVTKVESGELMPDSAGYVVLPLGYRHLSSNGSRIQVDQRNGIVTVLFYGKYNSPNEFTGYVYRSDNSPPPADIFGVQWRLLNQRRERWYFAVSYPLIE